MLALTISKSLTAATYFTIYPSCFTESQQSLGVGLAGHHFSETTHDHWLKPCIAACAPGSLMMQRWTEGGTSEVEDFRRRKVLKHQHIQVLIKKPGDLYIKGRLWRFETILSKIKGKSYKFEISNIDPPIFGFPIPQPLRVILTDSKGNWS